MAIRSTARDGKSMVFSYEPEIRKSWMMKIGKIPFTDMYVYQFDHNKRDAFYKQTVITDPDLLARIVEDDREAAFRAPFLAQLRADMAP